MEILLSPFSHVFPSRHLAVYSLLSLSRSHQVGHNPSASTKFYIDPDFFSKTSTPLQESICEVGMLIVIFQNIEAIGRAWRATHLMHNIADGLKVVYEFVRRIGVVNTSVKASDRAFLYSVVPSPMQRAISNLVKFKICKENPKLGMKFRRESCRESAIIGIPLLAFSMNIAQGCGAVDQRRIWSSLLEYMREMLLEQLYHWNGRILVLYGNAGRRMPRNACWENTSTYLCMMTSA